MAIYNKVNTEEHKYETLTNITIQESLESFSDFYTNQHYYAFYLVIKITVLLYLNQN